MDPEVRIVVFFLLVFAALVGGSATDYAQHTSMYVLGFISTVIAIVAGAVLLWQIMLTTRKY